PPLPECELGRRGEYRQPLLATTRRAIACPGDVQVSGGVRERAPADRQASGLQVECRPGAGRRLPLEGGGEQRVDLGPAAESQQTARLRGNEETAICPGDAEAVHGGSSFARGCNRVVGSPDEIEQRGERRVAERDSFDAPTLPGDRQRLAEVGNSRVDV